MDGPHWLEKVGEHSSTLRTIAGRAILFIVEKTISGCVHPCSIDDVVRVLELLPASDWSGLHTFVLRQPTRKQMMLSPVWGRLLYYAEVTNPKGLVLSAGPAIFLDAIKPAQKINWSNSLDPDDSRELDRLRADGHSVERTGRKYEVLVTAGSARNTQLYRTLIHEIGHWFDWLSKVEQPAARGQDYEALESRYFARPKAEREAFAHRYADEQRKRLEESGAIPFGLA